MLEVGVSIRFGVEGKPEARLTTRHYDRRRRPSGGGGETGSGRVSCCWPPPRAAARLSQVWFYHRLNIFTSCWAAGSGRSSSQIRERGDRLYSAGEAEWTQSTPMPVSPPALRGIQPQPCTRKRWFGRPHALLESFGLEHGAALCHLILFSSRRYAPAVPRSPGDRRRGGSGSGG